MPGDYSNDAELKGLQVERLYVGETKKIAEELRKKLNEFRVSAKKLSLFYGNILFEAEVDKELRAYIEDYPRDVENRIKSRYKQLKENEEYLIQQGNLIQGEAIIYLLEHGQKINEDFTVENAMKKADDLAFELEVKRRTGEDVYFSGCDNCDEWDSGDGGRCSCGNRRVAWERGYYHTFKKPDIIAEAY